MAFSLIFKRPLLSREEVFLFVRDSVFLRARRAEVQILQGPLKLPWGDGYSLMNKLRL